MKQAGALGVLLALGLWTCHLPAKDAADAPDGAPRGALDWYLEVTIGGVSTHTIVSFRKQADRLFIRPQDLESLGVDLSRPASASALAQRMSPGWIDLDSFDGLTYRVDERTQRIDLSLADQIRTPYALGRLRTVPAAATSDLGMVLNYDIVAQHTVDQAAASTAALSTEQRVFGPMGVLANTGVAIAQGSVTHYLRESTYYRYDAPASLTSFQAGDVLSSALGWTRAVRLGGVEFSRDFALRPDLITFPMPQLSGSAALPSTLDLYVNNVHQLSTDVPSGPFVINGVGALTGAGLATVVTRDMLGRAVSTTLPIYVDSRLLAAGLTSYSIEAGALRYNFGLRSFDYEGHLAANATYRHGLSDAITLEAHAESTADLVVSGLGVLVRIGTFGVLNASVTASTNSRITAAGSAPISAQLAYPQLAYPQPTVAPSAVSGPSRQILPAGSGEQVSLGYQITSTAFSIAVQSTRTVKNYVDLAAVGGTPAPLYLDQLTVSVPVGAAQTLGSSFIHLKDTVSGRSALAQLWYSGRVSGRTSAFLNVSRDVDVTHSWSANLGFSIDFGNRLSGYASAGDSGGHSLLGASLSRSADYGGGWEWSAQANRVGDTSTLLARGGYLSQYGEFTAAAEESFGHSAVSVEAVGGAVWMDGVLEESRHIGGGFALVSTAGLAGVPILHENRSLGSTDATGHLLVPDLNPYQHNNLGIDSLSLPADQQVAETHLDITPRGDSGVLARFPITPYVAATIVVVDAAGQFLPAGTLLHHAENGRDFTVGYDGLAFIEGLVAHNTLSVVSSQIHCSAQFDYSVAMRKSGILATLGQITCLDRTSNP